jgi:hypothetical protein
MNYTVKEKHKHAGIFQIFEKNIFKDNKFRQIDEIHNLITNICLEYESKILMGIAPNLWIKYLAIGDDSTAVAATDPVLGNEVFRTSHVSQAYSATGIVTTEFYVTDSDANGEDIQELGIFAGNTAIATVDTGKLISHVLWNYGVKASGIELLVRRTDTIS